MLFLEIIADLDNDHKRISLTVGSRKSKNLKLESKRNCKIMNNFAPPILNNLFMFKKTFMILVVFRKHLMKLMDYCRPLFFPSLTVILEVFVIVFKLLMCAEYFFVSRKCKCGF